MRPRSWRACEDDRSPHETAQREGVGVCYSMKRAPDHTADRTSTPTRGSDLRRGCDTPPTACGALRILPRENRPCAARETPGVTVGVVERDAQLRRADRRDGVSTV